MYAGNYKILLKDIRDVGKWKDILWLQSESLILLRSQQWPKQSTDSLFHKYEAAKRIEVQWHRNAG